MTTQGAQTPLLMTPKEAALALSLGETKVYELLATGEIESIKIGAARRIPRQAITDYVAAKMSTAKADSTSSLDPAS